ncbi:MAG: hypothetical protein KKG06_11750 [Bacteroidetes bacterium]|nr:hypothetical protein [Bacteroidota bacterium]
MSIYKVIAVEPRMIYCSYFHQVKLVDGKEDYNKAFKSLHQYLQKETDKIEKGLKKFQNKVLIKNTEMLMSVLSEYLQTPLQNDLDSIRKIVVDTLGKNCNQVGLNIRYGVDMSYTGEVVFLDTQYALLKRLEKSGSDYLKNLGLEVTSTDYKVFESLFIIESSLNLDIIEHFINKKNENVIRLFSNNKSEGSLSSCTLYNLIYSDGAAVQKLFDKEVVEIVIFFSKPTDIDYDTFNNSLIEALEKLWVTLQIPYITLMQKKLGLGRGSDSVLRLYLDIAQENVTETLRWLSMYKEVGFVRQTLMDEGKLIIKHLLK